jgi:hypothetical protein
LSAAMAGVPGPVEVVPLTRRGEARLLWDDVFLRA